MLILYELCLHIWYLQSDEEQLAPEMPVEMHGYNTYM